MKRCNTCGLDKPLDDFHVSKTCKSGRQAKCKRCRKVVQDAWVARNREANNAYRAQWAREHYDAAKRSAYIKRRRHKDRVAQKAWRDAHPEVKALWRKRWRERHPDLVAESIRRRVKRRYARKKGAKGTATKEQLAARVAYYGGLCWLCHAPATEMDHVKPLSKGGAHIPANLRPICGLCNRRKQDRWPFDRRMIA